MSDAKTYEIHHVVCLGGSHWKRRAFFFPQESAVRTQGDSSVRAIDTDSMEMAKNLGTFWPLPLYEAKFQGTTKPPKVAKEQIVMLFGEAGIIRDVEPCEPIGTTRLTQKVVKGIAKSSLITGSDLARDRAEVDAWYEAGRRKLAPKITQKAATDETEKTFVFGTKAQPKKKSKKDDEDEDFLDSLFESPFVPVVMDKEHKEPKESGKVGNRGGGGKQPKEPRNPTEPVPPQNSPKDKKLEAAARLRHKEINATETALLGGTQLIRQLQSKDAFSQVTVKALESLLTKLNSRMVPDLTKIYTEKFAEDVADDAQDVGMSCLERLKNMISQVIALQPLVAAINATQGPNACGEAMRDALHKAQAVVPNLPTKLKTICVERTLNLFLERKECLQ